jgi:hypothetical protein
VLARELAAEHNSLFGKAEEIYVYKYSNVKGKHKFSNVNMKLKDPRRKGHPLVIE